MKDSVNGNAGQTLPPAPLFGGITKEMWTVVLADNGAWLPTDIFADTEADAVAVLELIRRNAGRDIKPERWNTEGAKVTRCIVSIYPPRSGSATRRE